MLVASSALNAQGNRTPWIATWVGVFQPSFYKPGASARRGVYSWGEGAMARLSHGRNVPQQKTPPFQPDVGASALHPKYNLYDALHLTKLLRVQVIATSTYLSFALAIWKERRVGVNSLSCRRRWPA